MCAMKFTETITICNTVIASSNSIDGKLELSEGCESRINIGNCSSINARSELKINTVFDRFLESTYMVQDYSTSLAEFSEDGAKLVEKVEDMISEFKAPGNLHYMKLVTKTSGRTCTSIHYRTYENECYRTPEEKFFRVSEYPIKNLNEIPLVAVKQSSKSTAELKFATNDCYNICTCKNSTYCNCNSYNMKTFYFKETPSIEISMSQLLKTVKSALEFKLEDIFTSAVRNKTISSVMGANWSEHRNGFGTISGQDRIHPKTGLMTLGEILDFYMKEDGSYDFKQFTTLKDIANNCSMSKARGVKSFHKHEPSRFQKATKPQKQSTTHGDDTTELRKMIDANRAEIKEMKKMMARMQSMISAQQKIIEAQGKKINA